MEIRFQNSPNETRGMDTEALRQQFLCAGLMQENSIQLVYSHYDRMVIGGARPGREGLSLPNPAELRAAYFLERREMGIINVGGDGTVTADGVSHALRKLDCLYVGKGTRELHFSSEDPSSPAVFFLLSAPAHQSYPTTRYTREQAAPVELGAVETSNQRTIYKYIHDGGIQSCQLVMGLTVLKPGSVWNSVPPHTHTRRMEVYFYFDVPETATVFHFMGEPQQTRHLAVSNHQAVVSPPWSVHFGCGTSHYGFIWGMAGENKEFTDMDGVAITEIR